MAIELFGSQVAPYAAVACFISFLMTGHRGVYPSQILSMTKSSSLSIKQGGEMKGIGAFRVQAEEKEHRRQTI